MKKLLVLFLLPFFINNSYSQELKEKPPNPDIQNNELKENIDKLIIKENIDNKTKWIKPTEGKIANPFGNHYNFYGYYRAGHTGSDIANKIGTPIYAVDDGIVRFVKTKPNMRYGYYIVIEHKKNLYTLYGHLSKLLVKEGEKVKQGYKIALMGESGLASFPHLHFEVLNRFPIHDGAWGYNYICQERSDRDIKLFKNKKDTPKSDFLKLNEVINEYAFLDKDKKEISYIYRMVKNRCVEKKITDIIYYNPEKFLPYYSRVKIPSFNIIPKKKLTPSPKISPSSLPILKRSVAM